MGFQARQVSCPTMRRAKGRAIVTLSQPMEYFSEAPEEAIQFVRSKDRFLKGVMPGLALLGGPIHGAGTVFHRWVMARVRVSFVDF